MDAVTPVTGERTPHVPASEAARLLNRAGAILGEDGDEATLLERVALAALPELGVACTVDVLGPDGRLERRAAAHATDDTAGFDRPIRPVDAVHRALRLPGGEPLGVPATSLPLGDRPDAPVMPLALVVPLVADGRALGALTFGEDDPSRPYDEARRALAAGFGRLVALRLQTGRAVRDAHTARAHSDEAHALLEAVHAVTPVGLAHVDDDLRLVAMNPAFAALLERTPRSCAGAPLDELFAGAVPALSAVADRARSAERRATGVAVDVTGPDGALRHLDVSVAPIAAGPEGPGGFSLTVADVTERRRADDARRRTMRHLAALAAVGELLDAELELEPTLESIVRVAVEQLADWCVIAMPGDDGRLRSVALAHRDAGQAELVRRLEEEYPAVPGTPRGALEVLRTGRPTLFEDITDELLEAVARDERHLRLLRALRLRSAVIVPLISRGRRFGVLTLVSARADRRFDRDDVRVAEELARRSASAIDAAQLYRAADEARARAEATVALERRTHAALQQALDRARTLSEISGIIERSVDLEDEALAAVLQQLVPSLADAAEIELEAPALGHRHAVAVRTDASPPAEPPAVLSSELAFGLVRRGVRLGTLTCRWRSMATASSEELELFEEVADRLAVAADAAALSAERTVAARTLQSSLLPQTLPRIPGAVLAGRYLPARGGGEVGGDFYDVFPLGDGTWMLVIGDVCGKGVAAATVTAQARYTLRALAPAAPAPADALQELNRVLIAQREHDRFVTLAALRLHPVGAAGTARVEVACAGHPAPLLLRADGSHLAVPARGQLLGVFGTVGLEATELDLGPDEVLVAFTDGVTESDPHRLLEPATIAQHVAGAVPRGPGGVALAVELLARRRAPADHLPDDVAVLALALDA